MNGMVGSVNLQTNHADGMVGLPLVMAVARMSILHTLMTKLFLQIVVALSASAFAQSNQVLLQERLISPAVYELLMQKGATTFEQRRQVIDAACRSGQLGPSDCNRPR